MCLTLPKASVLLQQSLDLSKTQINVLWTLWDLKSTNYQSMINSETNSGEENLFVNRNQVEKGLSVKELQELLNLTQPAVQQALTSLLKRGFVKRHKKQKAYRYQATNHAFRQFQKQLSQYYKDLGRFIDPFLSASTATSALRKVRGGVSSYWNIQGWQEIGGFENFFVRKEHTHKNLSPDDLAKLERDFMGNKLTAEISQVRVGNSLVLKSSNSYTSPFHLESNIISGLWAIQNSSNGKEPHPQKKRNGFQLVGTE